MPKYFYDFHLHSCLSPCADNDMTPCNLAGMLKLAGLQIAALTDHNTTRNCPAFFAAAEQYGIVPVAGAELTTAEDIHMVCLFPDLAAAAAFDRDLQQHRTRIPNRTEIFGDQLILDAEDRVIGTEPYLLSNATDITVDAAAAYIAAFGGICYPAHIDRQANGILATLGAFPPELQFSFAELSDMEKAVQLCGQHAVLKEKRLLFGSDAHNLWNIPDKAHTIALPAAPGATLQKQLWEWLKI